MEYNNITEIFDAIDRSRAKVVGKVCELNDEQGNFRHAPEKWCVAQQVEHLAKTEESLSQAVEKILARAESANPSPASGKIEPPVSFVEIVEKWRGLKFEAPEAIRPEGAATIAESLARLEKSRASLHALRPRLEAIDLTNAKFPHPVFGALNLYYWLAFIGFHELHHLRQIDEILSHQ